LLSRNNPGFAPLPLPRDGGEHVDGKALSLDCAYGARFGKRSLECGDRRGISWILSGGEIETFSLDWDEPETVRPWLTAA